MGKAPPTTEFPSLRMENVLPHAFATTWQASMEEWGTQIKRAVEGVSEMLAEGLGLDRSTFLRAGEYGSHLLAPTATDLQKYGTEGSSESSGIPTLPVSNARADSTSPLAVFAGFHTGAHSTRGRVPTLHASLETTAESSAPHRSQLSHHPWPLPLPRLAYLGAEYGQADCGQTPAWLFARTGRQAARVRPHLARGLCGQVICYLPTDTLFRRHYTGGLILAGKSGPCSNSSLQ